jgi:hypothetical protein
MDGVISGIPPADPAIHNANSTNISNIDVHSLECLMGVAPPSQVDPLLVQEVPFVLYCDVMEHFDPFI